MTICTNPLGAAERLVVKAVEIHDAIIHETDAVALDVLCREAAAAIAEIVKATGTLADRRPPGIGFRQS